MRRQGENRSERERRLNADGIQNLLVWHFPAALQDLEAALAAPVVVVDEFRAHVVQFTLGAGHLLHFGDTVESADYRPIDDVHFYVRSHQSLPQ